MAATTAVVSPLSQILVRSTLVDRFALTYAGYWDAMWRISALYLTLVTTTLSLYYLPRIAEIPRWPEMRRELLLVYRTVLPLVIVASIAIFLARDLIISASVSQRFPSDARPFCMADGRGCREDWILAPGIPDDRARLVKSSSQPRSSRASCSGWQRSSARTCLASRGSRSPIW